MPFEVSFSANQYSATGRPDNWRVETARTLRQQFKASPFSLMPIAVMLPGDSDNVTTLESLHRRHVIAWNNLKEEVIRIANESTDNFRSLKPNLDSFLTECKCPPDTFTKIEKANATKNEVGAGVLTSALIDIYNAVGNVFVGFGNQNSRLQANYDDGSDMINVLRNWYDNTQSLFIFGYKFSFRPIIAEKTLNDFIEEFEKRTSDLEKTYDNLKRNTSSQTIGTTHSRTRTPTRR